LQRRKTQAAFFLLFCSFPLRERLCFTLVCPVLPPKPTKKKPQKKGAKPMWENILIFSPVRAQFCLPLGPSSVCSPLLSSFCLFPSKTKKNPLWNKRNSRILEATERLALTLIFRLHVAVVSFSSSLPSCCTCLNLPQRAAAPCLLSPLSPLSQVEPDHTTFFVSPRGRPLSTQSFLLLLTPEPSSSYDTKSFP